MSYGTRNASSSVFLSWIVMNIVTGAILNLILHDGNGKVVQYGDLRIIPRTATTFTLRGFIESPVSTGKGDY